MKKKNDWNILLQDLHDRQKYFTIKKKLTGQANLSLFIGGAEGARTPDLMTASHALSHLSYSPNMS